MYILTKNRNGDLIIWKPVKDAPWLMEYVTHVHNGTKEQYKDDILEYPQNTTLYSNIQKRIISEAQTIEELLTDAAFEVFD